MSTTRALTDIVLGRHDRPGGQPAGDLESQVRPRQGRHARPRPRHLVADDLAHAQQRARLDALGDREQDGAGSEPGRDRTQSGRAARPTGAPGSRARSPRPARTGRRSPPPRRPGARPAGSGGSHHRSAAARHAPRRAPAASPARASRGAAPASSPRCLPRRPPVQARLRESARRPSSGPPAT